MHSAAYVPAIRVGGLEMKYFFDTSAIIANWKKTDRNHEWARNKYNEVLEECGGGFGIRCLMVSSICKYELCKVYNDKNVTAVEEIIHLESSNVIRVDGEILRKAADLLDKYGKGKERICSFDAIQLACALKAKEKLSSLQFVCCDDNLCKAARTERLTINSPKND